jgi:hypothetical protein
MCRIIEADLEEESPRGGRLRIRLTGFGQPPLCLSDMDRSHVLQSDAAYVRLSSSPTDGRARGSRNRRPDPHARAADSPGQLAAEEERCDSEQAPPGRSEPFAASSRARVAREMQVATPGSSALSRSARTWNADSNAEKPLRRPGDPRSPSGRSFVTYPVENGQRRSCSGFKPASESSS